MYQQPIDKAEIDMADKEKVLSDRFVSECVDSYLKLVDKLSQRIVLEDGDMLRLVWLYGVMIATTSLIETKLDLMYGREIKLMTKLSSISSEDTAAAEYNES